MGFQFRPRAAIPLPTVVSVAAGQGRIHHHLTRSSRLLESLLHDKPSATSLDAPEPCFFPSIYPIPIPVSPARLT